MTLSAKPSSTTLRSTPSSSAVPLGLGTNIGSPGLCPFTDQYVGVYSYLTIPSIDVPQGLGKEAGIDGGKFARVVVLGGVHGDSLASL